ncbi:hypothetical protein D9M70_632750 [compost metagenome]
MSDTENVTFFSVSLAKAPIFRAVPLRSNATVPSVNVNDTMQPMGRQVRKGVGLPPVASSTPRVTPFSR